MAETVNAPCHLPSIWPFGCCEPSSGSFLSSSGSPILPLDATVKWKGNPLYKPSLVPTRILLDAFTTLSPSSSHWHPALSHSTSNFPFPRKLFNAAILPLHQAIRLSLKQTAPSGSNPSNFRLSLCCTSAAEELHFHHHPPFPSKFSQNSANIMFHVGVGPLVVALLCVCGVQADVHRIITTNRFKPPMIHEVEFDDKRNTLRIVRSEDANNTHVWLSLSVRTFPSS